MADEDDDDRAGAIGLALLAGQANLVFLSGVVAALVKRGALTEFEVFEAMAQEQEFIEALRRDGDPMTLLDARQAAGWLERLNELLCRRLFGPAHDRSLLGDWRPDPSDPCYPHGPANDDD